MIPLLAIPAARIGATALQNVAENITSRPSREAQASEQANRTEFPAALSRAANSPEVRRMRLLDAEGIHDRAEAGVRVGQLAMRIAQSPELREFTTGSGGGYDMRIQADGKVEVRTADGMERTITLHGDDAELALEAVRLLDLTDAQWPSTAPIGRSNNGLEGRNVVHITPGAGASVR